MIAALLVHLAGAMLSDPGVRPLPLVISGYKDRDKIIVEMRRPGHVARVKFKGSDELLGFRFSPGGQLVIMLTRDTGGSVTLRLLRSRDLATLDTQSSLSIGYVAHWKSDQLIVSPSPDDNSAGLLIPISKGRFGRSRRGPAPRQEPNPKKAEALASVINALGFRHESGLVAPEFTGRSMSFRMGSPVVSHDYNTVIFFAERNGDRGHTRILRKVNGTWTVKSMRDESSGEYLLGKSSFAVVRGTGGGNTHPPGPFAPPPIWTCSVHDFSGKLLYPGFRGDTIDLWEES